MDPYLETLLNHVILRSGPRYLNPREWLKWAATKDLAFIKAKMDHW
jgi:hypothetical protein